MARAGLALNLIGTTSNRDGIGARIKLMAGTDIQIAQKKSTTGYLSQNDPRVYFGLDAAVLVDRLEVIWPSGKTQVIENIKANQILTLKEP